MISVVLINALMGCQYQVFPEPTNAAKSDSLMEEEELAKAPTVLMPAGSYANQVTNGVLQNPDVIGILIGTSWRDIEDSEGVFDWSRLDERIDQATAAGKAVTLNLFAGGRNTPDWVKQLPGVELYSFIDTSPYHSTYCQEDTMPVFWDPVFLEKKKAFIRAAGERYADNPDIVGVMVSFANANSNEWHVPHAVGDVCDTQVDQVQDWLDAGYTTTKMLDAGKETIDAWADAFPGQALKLPIAPTHRDLDGSITELAELIVDYGYATYPDRFFAQMNGLSTKIPYADDPDIVNAIPDTPPYFMKLLLDHSPQIGLQMLAGASNGDTDNCRLNGKKSPCPPVDVLQETVEIGLSYHPSYIEYWYVDAENPELRPVLQYANQMMEGRSEVYLPLVLKGIYLLKKWG